MSTVRITDHAAERIVQRCWHGLPWEARRSIREILAEAIGSDVRESSRLFLGPAPGGSHWLVIGEAGLYVVQRVRGGAMLRVITALSRTEGGIFDAVTPRGRQFREELLEAAEAE